MKRLHYILGAVSAVLGTALCFAATPFWWLGAGLVAGGCAGAAWAAREPIRRLVEWARRERTIFGVEYVPAYVFAELACIAAIAALNVVMLPKTTLGDRPVAHDHTVHFYKSWQLVHEFLAEGRLFGWSHTWFAGYPAQYLYPIGGDLLVGAVYASTLGTVEFGTAYAWSVWLVWFLGGYSVYRLGAGAFGRWTGLLAAILFMTDMGAFRIGGWKFTVIWGVWPMTLAAIWVVWGVARIPRLMDGDRWRDVAIFGVLVGAALMTHPFAMIHLALVIGVALFAYWLAERQRHWLVGAARLGLGTAVGVLIACLWLIPFFAFKEAMDPHFGGVWSNMLKMGRGMYDANLLEGTWSVAIALGTVGVVALVWSRNFQHLLIGMLSVALIVVGSTDFLASFSVIDLFGSFQRVHFKRFITLLKPYFLLAAAYTVHAAGSVVYRRAVRLVGGSEEGDGSANGLQPFLRRWLRYVVLGMCLAPLAVPFLDAYAANHLDNRVKTASERGRPQARVLAAEWFNEKFPEGEPFFRVASKLGWHNHSVVDFARRIPFPLYKIGYTPATSYLHRYETGRPSVLNQLNVRYAISFRGPPAGDFEKVETFQGMTVYENQNWNEEPFEVVEGSGEVEVVDWSDEEIVLEAGSEADGRLRLNVSSFDRWRAYRDGEPVEIGESEIDIGSPNGFLTVDLAPGRYRFVFERGFAERAAFVCAFVGLLLVVAFVLADTRLRYVRRLAELLERARAGLADWTRRRERLLNGVGAAGAVGLVLVAGTLAWMRPSLTVQGKSIGDRTTDVHYDFGHQLREAKVRIERGDDRTDPCRGMFGYFICGRKDWKAVHHRVADFGHELSMARCIWAHPLPRGPVQLRFDDVPVGDALVGYYGVPESGRTNGSKPVHFDAGWGGEYQHGRDVAVKEQMNTFRIPVRSEVDAATVDVAFRVEAKHPGRRHFCFLAQMVDRRDGTVDDRREREGEQTRPASDAYAPPPRDAGRRRR